MKMPVVSVRDSAVNAYMRPFAVPAIGAAVRSFQDEVQRSDSDLNKHPEDYELFEIGQFDDETGLIIASSPRSLARAVDFKGG